MVDDFFGSPWGGPWTQQKLTCLRRYLLEYRKIFKANPRARYYSTWFVDAFAGTGSRPKAVSSGALWDLIYGDDEAKQYQVGSARIALELESPFDNYLFIEKSKARSATLEKNVRTDYPQLAARCKFRTGDANLQLKAWCSERDWSKERAVVFLDPFGLEVEWDTVRVLAETTGVDLWYLFPAIARLLPRDGNIPALWKARLNRLFGTEAWQGRFWQAGRQTGLFGDGENTERTVSEDVMTGFLHERLTTCFGKKVARILTLRNSKQSPLYFLCFGASNEKGAGPALRIANYILDESY